MALRENLVANIDAACERRGWSVRELARQSGVHFTTISRIRTGKLDPSLGICDKLAAALGIDSEKMLKKPRAAVA